MSAHLPGEPVLRLPVTKPRPKGLAPYRPRPGSKNSEILSAALAVLVRYEAEGRLPLGPREVGYVLTGDEWGFTKADIDTVEDVIVRARRAGLIPWHWISDGRTGSAIPWTVRDGEALADELLGQLPDAHLDRQAGQANRVEVWAEAMGWLPRLERICGERGVSVYSGSGSVPVPAIRQAVLRAIFVWNQAPADRPVRTVILQIGDLDLNGIRNIARPFVDDVRQFAADILKTPLRGVERLITVRRIMLTAGQVERYVGERARVQVGNSAEHIKAGWPYPFTAQAEALPPELRDSIVAEAIDSLHDVALREQVIADEPSLLHEQARTALQAKLNGKAT